MLKMIIIINFIPSTKQMTVDIMFLLISSKIVLKVFLHQDLIREFFQNLFSVFNYICHTSDKSNHKQLITNMSQVKLHLLVPSARIADMQNELSANQVYNPLS